ncbi:unnamed protein product [Litomosoides sigmodontis]|uniref:Uncharacterized protein n=1 Tax=Litomosoides sigmodontis TaxID=42156 RepID=A0A3P6U7N9_LITSI|nr:unnamed protein product [Litomosoides sigmodontis]
MDEAQHILSGGSAESRRFNERRRKRKNEKEKKEDKKYSNILFSCVTVRQLRNLLNKVDKKDSDERRTNEGVDGKVVGRGAVRRLTSNKAKQQKAIKKQPTKVSHPVAENGVGARTFPVAAISMGLFIANGGNTGGSCCNVTFCFISRQLRYDFSYCTGVLSYRAGYKVAFNHLEAINFQGYYVNFKLAQPVEQEYCNRESITNNKRTVSPCNDFDITLGQYKTALVHVIRLNGDESSAWIYHLLNTDEQFFKPLIRRVALMTGENNSNYSTNAAPSKPLAVDPATLSLYSNDHSDPYSFAASKCLPTAPSHTVQYGNMNSEIVPVRYSETTSASTLSAPFTSYTIEQSQSAIGFNGGENSWQPEVFIAQQEAKPCSDVPQAVAVESTAVSNEGCTYRTADEANNNCRLQIQECFSEDNAQANQSEETTGSNAISSMYVVSEPEKMDSEGVPEKSESQYILSDLDLLFQ